MQHSALRIASDRDDGPESTFHALALELAAAREVTLDLQLTVAELVGRLGGAPREALFRLQDLDRLAQTLGDLATFTEAVAHVTPAGWKVDAWAAARSLHLRDLAVRLCSGGATCAAAPPAPESEDDFLL